MTQTSSDDFESCVRQQELIDIRKRLEFWKQNTKVMTQLERQLLGDVAFLLNYLDSSS